MKIHHLFFLVLMSTRGQCQYFRLPSPPRINFGRFKPLLQAFFSRPSLFRPGFHHNRPPPPLPPPLDPPLHPPMLAPIHSPMKPPPPLQLEGFNEPFHPAPQKPKFNHRPPSSVMKAPPSAVQVTHDHSNPNHGFGAPKPNSIISMEEAPVSGGRPAALVEDNPAVGFQIFQGGHQIDGLPNFQEAGQLDHSSEPLLKPQAVKMPVRSLIKLATPPLRTQHSVKPDDVIHEIRQPVKINPNPRPQPNKNPVVVKLRPIKISRPRPGVSSLSQERPPAKIPNQDFVRPIQKLIPQFSSFKHPNSIRTPVKNIATGFSNTHKPQRPNFNQEQAVFISQNQINTNHLPDTNQPFQNLPFSNENKAVSQVPKLNAGVLPLADELREPPNLRFPPFV